MLDIWSQYATDPKAELEGREVDWGGGVKLIIARAHNPKYTRMLAQQYEAHKHTLDQKETDEQLATAEDRSNKIMAHVMSRSILLGWTGPLGFQGKELPYSVANAEMLLQIKDFQAEVAKKAADFRNFRVKAEEVDEKNSPTTSAGI
jgi:hypothetical protein